MDDRGRAVELLRLRDELDALDRVVPDSGGFRFTVFVVVLFLFLWIVGALDYVPVAFGAVIFAGVVVQERRVRRARLLRQREEIQRRIHRIEDDPGRRGA